MAFTVLHFRESDRVLREMGMEALVKDTLAYVDEVLQGAFYKGPLLRTALDDMGWRQNGSLSILDGRRYQYKGFWKRVGIEANLNAYEFILEGLFRLQLGFDKGILDAGVLLLTAKRSGKSPLGSSEELAAKEMESLYPTISLPVAVALFDLGDPEIVEDEGGDQPAEKELNHAGESEAA